MDRRGFLRLAGIGGAVASVAPALILPAVQKLAVPDPQRRFFLPPAGGWPVGNQSINTAQVQWIVSGQLEPGGYFLPQTVIDDITAILNRRARLNVIAEKINGGELTMITYRY